MVSGKHISRDSLESEYIWDSEGVGKMEIVYDGNRVEYN